MAVSFVILGCGAPAQSGAGTEGVGAAGIVAASLPELYPARIERASGPPLDLQVELALTDRARRRGLMFRRGLPEGRGMLFVYAAEGRRHFWMRNTLIPLDMVFFDAARQIVGFVRSAVPQRDELLGPEAPAQYVLEVGAGFAERHGLREGDRILLPPALASGALGVEADPEPIEPAPSEATSPEPSGTPEPADPEPLGELQEERE